MSKPDVKKVRVGSRLTMDLQISSNPEHVVTGVSHPSTDGMAVTENLPADVVERFFEEHAASLAVAGQFVFVLPDDFDATPQPKEYGFQPALDRATEDPKHVEDAAVPVDDPEAELRKRAGTVVRPPDDLPPPPAPPSTPAVRPDPNLPVVSDVAVSPAPMKPA